MQAAKWGGYTVTEFDKLDVWAQAEVMAGYLAESRLEAVMNHRSRQQSPQGAYDPFANEEKLD